MPAEAPRAAQESTSDSRFFNSELSLLDYSERLLALAEELTERLRRAGAATPAQTSGYTRALGPRASQPREVLVPRLASGATAGEVVRRAIAASVVRLTQHDAMMLLDTSPKGVHQARVATRRLRSDLRTFRPLLDREWASSLRDELGWLARVLGVVRDGDVMLERIHRHAAQLPEVDARGTAAVVATLEAARGEDHARLLETLQGERYLALLDRLVVAANAPALPPGRHGPSRARSPPVAGARQTGQGARRSANGRGAARGPDRSKARPLRGRGRGAPARPPGTCLRARRRCPAGGARRPQRRRRGGAMAPWLGGRESLDA